LSAADRLAVTSVGGNDVQNFCEVGITN